VFVWGGRARGWSAFADHDGKNSGAAFIDLFSPSDVDGRDFARP
jgi:hypothetical protein